jgi:hypothetical protein
VSDNCKIVVQCNMWIYVVYILYMYLCQYMHSVWSVDVVGYTHVDACKCIFSVMCSFCCVFFLIGCIKLFFIVFYKFDNDFAIEFHCWPNH